MAVAAALFDFHCYLSPSGRLEIEQEPQVTAVCRLGRNPLAGKRVWIRHFDVGLNARSASVDFDRASKN
jgi:hypothetical protein